MVCGLGVDLRTFTKKDVCSKEIGLRAQYLFAILGLIVNIMGGPMWPFNKCKNLHFDNESDMQMSSKNHEEKRLWPQSGFVNHIALSACFISYEK